MTKKYEVELFEGDWGVIIDRYDTIEEAEEEYESWNNSKKLYEERKEDNKVLNLKEEDCYGYVWQDQYGRVLEYFKKWKDIKNEK